MQWKNIVVKYYFKMYKSTTFFGTIVVDANIEEPE